AVAFISPDADGVSARFHGNHHRCTQYLVRAGDDVQGGLNRNGRAFMRDHDDRDGFSGRAPALDHAFDRDFELRQVARDLRQDARPVDSLEPEIEGAGSRAWRRSNWGYQI